MKTKQTNLSIISFLIMALFSTTACTQTLGGFTRSPLNASITKSSASSPVNTAPITSFTLANSFSPVDSTNRSYVVHDLFARDLNKDRVDEIIYAGRVSNYSGAIYEEVNLNIFGWNVNKSKLTNETTRWFSPGENKIKGTEPTVLFGNFTGGGTDIFLAQSTDRPDENTMGPAVIFKNTGKNKLTRIELPGTTSWSHGSATFDINGDGKMDIMAVSYNNNSFTVLGGVTPKVFSDANSNSSGTDSQGRAVAGVFGSGLTIGKFLNNNKVYAIVADSPYIDGVPGSWGRVAMMEVYAGFHYENGVKTTKEIAGVIPSTAKLLPLPHLEAEKASSMGMTELDYIQRGDSNISHDTRVITLKVNNDKFSDIAVISRPNAPDNNWGAVKGDSYVTFYKNNGDGTFSRVGLFFKENARFYNVETRDINGDGRADLILSAQQGNTSILIAKQQKNGDIVYVEAGSNVIKAFEDKIRANTGGGCTETDNWCVGATNIVRGPGGKNYVVGIHNEYPMTGGQISHTYYSIIGNKGTLTLNGAIQTLMSQWNLTEKQATEILKLTGTNYADGTVINIDAAMQPVRGLWFPMNGKMVALQGGVSGIAPNEAIKNFTGVDYYNRNFSLDIGQRLSSSDYWSQRSYQAINHGLASMQLQNTDIITIGNFKFNSTNDPMEGAKSWAMGVSGIAINDNTEMSMSISKVPFNPWFSMSGTWGQLQNSSIIESSILHTTGPWSYRGGLMQVTSEYTPGLVTAVKPIYAGWADVEYMVNDNLKVATGVLPYAFAGSVSMTLPTGIDNQGQFSYTSSSASIKDTMRGYARINYTGLVENHKNISYSFTGLITDHGVPAGRATLNYSFK
jgi:hypothetical protein